MYFCCPQIGQMPPSPKYHPIIIFLSQNKTKVIPREKVQKVFFADFLQFCETFLEGSKFLSGTYQANQVNSHRFCAMCSIAYDNLIDNLFALKVIN